MLVDRELSFHEAIRSGDADARLIYADWLEDQGQSEESAMLREVDHAGVGRWCLVSAGRFWMGGGGGTPGDKEVTIHHAFYLGDYLVTQEQWQEVMGNNPSWFSRTGGGKDAVKDVPDEELKLFPVESVSWNDSQEFIRKLNSKEHGSGFLYRLPTEVEWEYACRGAASSKQECSFHFYFDNPTNDLSSGEANFDGRYLVGKGAKGKYLGRPTRVGSYKPNRLGLYDMHGNIWEWCNDLSTASARVLRGGSWCYLGGCCRSASRSRNEPDLRYGDCGFRLVRAKVTPTGPVNRMSHP